MSDNKYKDEIRSKINQIDFPIDGLDFEQKRNLHSYHIHKLQEAFKDVYTQTPADANNIDLATTTAVTLRSVGFPVTLKEIAKDFDVNVSTLKNNVEHVRDKSDIDLEIEKTYKKEKRMLLVQNLDYSVDFKQGFNTLLDDIYDEELESDNDVYSYECVLITSAWIASKLSAIDTDTLYISEIATLFDDVSQRDIINCYLGLYHDNEHRIKPSVFDDCGIMDHITETTQNTDIDTDVQYMIMPWLDEFLRVYDNKYDNKTVAIILLNEYLNRHYTYGTSDSKINRIGSKIREEYDLNKLPYNI